MATLALMVLLGVAGLVSALLDASGATGDLHLAGQSRVVVRPGDTLWSIASSVAGQDDVRAVVYRIRQVNHLHGTELMPGEVLVLP